MKRIVVHMIAVLLCAATKHTQAVTYPNFPPKRVFLPIKHSQSSHLQLLTTLRVLQFNILADGLSGLRSDVGGFSRARTEWVTWDTRKHMLLKEILQYEPDIVTLQECDHYYDFFLPALASEFDGIFAPKPASACLEVSPRSDGCAVFVRKSKLKIASTETITFALPYDVHPQKQTSSILSANTQSASAPHHWKFKRLQNQVALVAECEILPDIGTAKCEGSVPIIIATTHLKAAKTAKGERVRHLETELVLSAIDRCAAAVLQRHRVHIVPIVLAADLNAVPTKYSVLGYESTVYPYIKQHQCRYRSVLNDDVIAGPVHNVSDSIIDTGVGGGNSDSTDNDDTISVHRDCSKATHCTDRNSEIKSKCSPEYTVSDTGNIVCTNSDCGLEDAVWTTWKARCKLGAELVVKHCIDYIMYATARAQYPAATAISVAENATTPDTVASDTHSSAQNSGTTRNMHSDWQEEYVIRAVAALSPLLDEHVGKSLLPNEHYPSDHVAIAADLQVLRKLR